MKRQTLSTTEAAYILGIDPRSLVRWARERGVEPERRMRIGRSTVTVWSVARLTAASQLDTAEMCVLN